MSADAVLSVEVRAKLDALSTGLNKAKSNIGDFVAAGDRNLTKIEAKFESLGKTTKDIANNIKSALGGISLDQYFKNFENGKAVFKQSKVEVQKYKEEIERLKSVSTDLSNQIKEKTKALNDARVATEQSKQATERSKQATEAEKAAFIAERTELVRLTAEKKKIQQQTVAANGSYREAQQRLTALGKAIREAEGGFDATSPKVRAQVSEYNSLNNKLKEFDKSLGNHQRNVGNYTSSLSGILPFIGQVSTVAGMATLAVNTLNKAKNTIFDFNNGILNVSKTTGLAGKDLTQLSDDIVELSRNLKTVGTPRLLEYATVAGQLGIKGRQNIIGFTEALAKLETASNITGEQGGAEIARMLTLVDGGVQNVGAFGDEIVNLGNNFAATEKEILSNAEAIAQNVGIYKIGRQQILAFATATKSIGVEAELVGSTFNRTLAIFEKAIRTGEGLEAILIAVGGSQKDLAERFKTDAAGVFVDYIKSLNNVYKSGGSVNEQLERIGINAVRDQRVIQSLAANGYDVLTKALHTVSNSAGAMNQEFTTASEKLIKQTERIDIAWQNLVLSVENGEGAIGRATGRISGFFANVVDSITDLVKTSTNAWDVFAAFSPGYLIDSALEKGREQKRVAGREKGEFSINRFMPKSTLYEFDKLNEAQAVLTTTQSKLGAEIVKNKSYWEDQVKSISAVRDGLEDSETGGKRWLELTKQIKDAQGKVDLYSDKKGDSASKKKENEALRLSKSLEKQQLDLEKILIESNSRVSVSSLSGIKKEVQEINNKYDTFKKRAIDSVRDPKKANETIEELTRKASETLLQIEKYRVDEIHDYSVKKMQQTLQKRETEETKLAKKISDANMKIQQDKVEIDLVFSRKLDETASQKAVRQLNNSFEKKRNELKEILNSQIKAFEGVKSPKDNLSIYKYTEKKGQSVVIDFKNRESKLQDDYFKDVEDIYKRDQQLRLKMVDSRNPFNVFLEKNNILLEENVRKMQALDPASDNYISNIDALRNAQTKLLNQKDGLSELQNTYNQFTTGVGNSLGNMLTGTESFANGMENVFKNMVSSIIQQMARLAALKFFGAFFTGGASLVMPGFSSGGFTGNVGRDKVAGVVHGQEMVINADATRKYRPMLEQINSGKIPTVDDFTPKITKNISRFTPSTSMNRVQKMEVDVNVAGRIENNTIKVSGNRATRFEDKFGRGRGE